MLKVRLDTETEWEEVCVPDEIKLEWDSTEQIWEKENQSKRYEERDRWRESKNHESENERARDSNEW